MKHRMVIIGFGNQGQWHADNIRQRVPEIEVVGAYDISADRAAAISAAGLSSFASLEDALSAEADIALVCTPNHVHKEQCIAALLAGKNVVCEKPVCMNAAELDEVLEAARRTGKAFTVHQNRRWDADYRVVKNIIDKGIIGKPYFIDSRLFGCKGLPGDWRAARVSGGGMLYDWSVHLIDQMLDLIHSRPECVYVEAAHVRFPEVDDCNRILVRFRNGLRYQIVVDSWCYIGENRWHLCGDDGTAVVPVWGGTQGRVIKANIKEVGWEKGFVYTANGRSSTMAPRPKESLEEFDAPLCELPEWEEFYRNFVAAIEGREEPIVTHSQMRAVMRVLDACFRSAERGTAVWLS